MSAAGAKASVAAGSKAVEPPVPPKGGESESDPKPLTPVAEGTEGAEAPGGAEAAEEEKVVDRTWPTGPARDNQVVGGIKYRGFQGEHEMDPIMALMEVALSEPYSVFTYRYFLTNWPDLTILALDGDTIIGAIVGMVTPERGVQRGYIAMLAVEDDYRRKGIASHLASMLLERMKRTADEVALEAEYNNTTALRFYERLGFIREKRLPKYYLNGSDAFRLRLWF